jgi:hypothetical protein
MATSTSAIEHYRLRELTNSTGVAVWTGRNAQANEGYEGSSSAGESSSVARWCRIRSLRVASMSSSAGVSRSMKFRRTSSTCPGAAFSMAARPHLVGETALLPAQCVAQGVGGHAVPVESREHRQDLVVGPGQARFLKASVQVDFDLLMRVHEGSPGAVFTRVQPVRFHQPPCYPGWLTYQQSPHMVEESTFSPII